VAETKGRGLAPTMPAMSRRTPLRRAWPFVVFLSVVAGACAAQSGVATERADSPSGPSSTTEDPSPPDTEPSDTSVPSTAPDSDPTASTVEPTGELQWNMLTDGVETTTLQVPIDYEDPDGPTFDLFVARHLATDQENKIGSLLVNPGGPGFGGSDFAIYADQIYDPELLERFDIIGWDPRGTGKSEPAIDCIDDYDHYFSGTDITPDDAAERQQLVDLAEEFADNCADNNGDFFEYVGTNNSARDMDSIRRALGEDQISYFGFSYGSELGATWATLFPDTVRAAVLDGAADPTADMTESGIQQAAGFEGTLDTYLAQCSDDSSCAFHNDGDAEGAFDQLMLDLDDEPIPSEPGRPDVTRGVALQAVAQAMYSESFWDQLSEALADAQTGDGAGLLALYDSYYQRQSDGTWGNELEAFQTISCMDDPERLTVEEDDETAPEYIAVAPRFAPGTTGTYFCTFFPAAVDPRVEITGDGAGPIVVIGTTGDPATPLSSTRAMADTLEDGRLVVVDADQHTGYGVNDCVNDAVHRYLVDLDVPAEDIEC
jgi:pimeloyl-ACP methyl ester carboxylesterase